MGLGRTLAHRFLDAAKFCSGQMRSRTATAQCSVFRRPIVQAAVPPDRMPLLVDGDVFTRISGIDSGRIWKELFTPLPPSQSRVGERDEAEMGVKRMTSMEEVKKALKASRMEIVRSRLRAISRSSVSYSEFMQICREASSEEQRMELARCLDESGVVIVLGNVVLLRPDQVAKALENAIPLPLASRLDPRREELRELERQKAVIDEKAKAMVRRELWCGLVFFAAQTVGFIRLTFWELSWDVMEPICFYATSSYFLAGYVFFMRTSTELSFEGFFKRRFATKQEQLMKAFKFDARRFDELAGVWSSSCARSKKTTSTMLA
ncbi:hypothetical protein HPP92_022715 [Vanilla planifolia]|uniref:Calcium uniporter protein C-terminal domain-containing protein n=1 Tax=Vanilla planifolia TaxID=51239 RepID=A0A835PRE6_VANPL|nr:hypothetical protein HPP92_022715 [Vanilla planifolia]